MSNKYEGTQTEKNLQAAFAGESQARNKYTYFSSVAKKEGYEQISSIFLKTADNEKEHAKMWFKELNGIGCTADNLAAAADGENYEWTDMYDEFAKPQTRKDFMNWRRNFVWLAPLRRLTRKDTDSFFITLKLQLSLKRARLRYGSAETAAIL